MQNPSEPSLAEKIDFLRQAERYPDGSRAIEVVETHFAWVFLTSNLAYKLKKPIRFRDLDMTSLAARKRDCDLELTLNRRLARWSYLGVVPLAMTRAGLSLEGSGPPVDWLVKMRRLPAERALIAAARDGQASASDLRALVTKLSRFYRSTSTAPWTPAEYREKLRGYARENGRQLRLAELRMEPAAVDAVVSSQCRFIEQRGVLLEERIAQARVVDAHGDLRPEHIFLLEDPQVIDCLEFDAALRLLDSASEIAFLGLECERLGYAALGETISSLYRDIAGDRARPELLSFYRSVAAVNRALASAWHLVDAAPGGTKPWTRRANWYLAAARASLDEALA